MFLTDGSSYELIQFISTPNFSTDLTIYVKGNPFNGVSSTIENFIIRPNNIFGKYQYFEKVIPKFINSTFTLYFYVYSIGNNTFTSGLSYAANSLLIHLNLCLQL